MNKEQLIHVFEDTCARIDAGEYPATLTATRYLINDFSSNYLSLRAENLTVDNDDCLVVAEKFSRLGKTCVLNMASPKHPGGGVRRGAMSQEEELARRSNLMYGLPESFYPLAPQEYIYTPGVTFFKDRYYQIIPEFTCDVITLAALNLREGIPPQYEEIMEQKIRTLLHAPFMHDCTNLVVSAFGCGVFKNQPEYVAGVFHKLLREGFLGLYDNLSFAIYNDHNSVSDNFKVFHTILT